MFILILAKTFSSCFSALRLSLTMEGDQNSPRGYPTLEHIPVLTVACLILLDTSCPLLAMISGVLLVVDLLLYMYCNPPRADVPYSIDEQGGDGSSTLVPGVLSVASVGCEHLNTHAILVTEAVFPTYDVPMNSLPLPFGPHAIYPFPEPLDCEW